MNVQATSHWANSDSANLMTRLSMLWKLHVLMMSRSQWRKRKKLLKPISLTAIPLMVVFLLTDNFE